MDTATAATAWTATINAALAQLPRALSHDHAIAVICAATGWPVGHVWTRGPSGWRSSGAWHVTNTATDPTTADRYRALREATAVTDLGSGRGIVAAVLHLEACRFLPGLEGLGSPLRQQTAAALGLRGVIGVPVEAKPGHDINAILEFVTATDVEPDGELAEALVEVAARCQGRSPRTSKMAKTALIPPQAKPIDVALPDHLAG